MKLCSLLNINDCQKSSDLKLSEDSPKTGNYNIPWTDEEQVCYNTYLSFQHIEDNLYCQTFDQIC